jgi:hypothetical protein
MRNFDGKAQRASCTLLHLHWAELCRHFKPVLILELGMNLCTATGADESRVSLKPFKRFLENVATVWTLERESEACHGAALGEHVTTVAA